MCEEEWEKAARGIDGRVYSWGNEFDKDKCNTDESKIGHTTPVKDYKEARSPYGCFDMAGNVWEWTDSWDEKKEEYRVLRGGSWYSFRNYARCADRFGNHAGLGNYDIGFRCARTLIFFMVPEPCLSGRTGERIIEVQALLLCWPFGQPKHKPSLPGLVATGRTSG